MAKRAVKKTKAKTSKSSKKSNFLVGGIKTNSPFKIVLIGSIIALVLALVGYSGWYVYKNNQINQTKAAASTWTKLGEVTIAAPIDCDHPGVPGGCPNPYPVNGAPGKTMTLKYYACRLPAVPNRGRDNTIPQATYQSFKFFVANSYKVPNNRTERVTGVKVIPVNQPQPVYYYPDSRDLQGTNMWWAGVVQSYTRTLNVQAGELWNLLPYLGNGITATGQRIGSGAVSKLPAVNVGQVVSC